MTVKEFLTEYCFADNDTVFLCQYGKRKIGTPCLVQDIPGSVMRKQLVKVQAHFGGVDYDYSSHRLIYR